MFYVPDIDAHVDIGMPSMTQRESIVNRSWALSGFFPGGIIPLSDIRVGDTCYRLRQPLTGKFFPSDHGMCEFWVNGFSPLFLGSGRLAQEAYQDWRDQVHESFQILFGKRPFEMSKEELEQWHVLDGMIDVVSYRNETPVVVRQIGKVDQARPFPRRIEWIDGKLEYVRLEDMPGEFASYKPGQPFEADVERDPLSWKLLKVRFVRRLTSIQPMPEGKLNKFWQSIPTTKSLPVSGRKWTES